MEAQFLPLGFNQENARQLIESNDFDGILLTSPESIAYVSGYPCLPSSGNPILFAIRNHYPCYVFINKNGERTLFAWEYSLLDITIGAENISTHVNAEQALANLAKCLETELGQGKHLAVESSCPYELITQIQSWVAPTKISIIDQELNQLRLIKTGEEMELLRQSCSIAEQTFNDLIPMVKAGLMRSDLIRLAKIGMLRNGASGIGHCTISFGASNPEVEINEKLEANRLVIIDLGAMNNGYASDIRRMLYTGKIPANMLQLHHTMCRIVETIGNSLTVGVSIKQLISMAERLYIQAGLNPNFTHFGHTIGMNTEEIWCDRSNTMVLEAGMVINVELYSMTVTGENIGDEETYIVTNGKPERLNKLPREIIQIMD